MATVVKCAPDADQAINGTAEVRAELPPVKRSSFPPDFLFGAATSAYQIEGAHNEGGRKPSIWDTFCHAYPGRIADQGNGDIALDSYHRFKEDVKMLKDMGANAFRFSISWPRILPDGRGKPNTEGITFYNSLVDELIANAIQPFVTIFHWDVPQALEDEYGGFLDRRIADDLKHFSQACFEAFGDRVKHWLTVNEPSIFCWSGYDVGLAAPGRCSDRSVSSKGDSATEPYVVAHNMLLAHAQVVQLYREKYQEKLKGEIGLSMTAQWPVPYSTAPGDIQASTRSLDFEYGWFMEPLVYGDYPFTMRAIVRERLPCFTEEEANMVRGSYDFIGINYYSGMYVQGRRFLANAVPTSYTDDKHLHPLPAKGGVPIGEPGIHDLLLYTKEHYKNPKMYITENGTCEIDTTEKTMEQMLDDQYRLRYLREHVKQVHEAMRKGANVRGYLHWSLWTTSSGSVATPPASASATSTTRTALSACPRLRFSGSPIFFGHDLLMGNVKLDKSVVPCGFVDQTFHRVVNHGNTSLRVSPF